MSFQNLPNGDGKGDLIPIGFPVSDWFHFLGRSQYLCTPKNEILGQDLERKKG